MSRIRIGAVSYLNTKPLVEGLNALPERYELVFDLPGRLADSLEKGDLDVALIPCIEAVNQDYTIVSDACIACSGPVWSVKLMSRVAPPDIRTLALDEGSRTSRILTRILLARKHGVHPECRSLAINEDWRECEADAALIIGDRAMSASDTRFPFEYDLGEAWNLWTGMPFVFAFWAARNKPGNGAMLSELDEVLSAARDRGLQVLERLATENCSSYGLSREQCYDYLSNKLDFTLTGSGKEALAKYYQLAAELDLVPESSSLQFHAAAC
ncbi:MAG: menaquinone biosynthesis protein [Planctomycetota bacterium]